METSILYILKAFILPPGIHISICILGYCLLKKHLKTGKFLIILSILSLYLFSTHFFSQQLAKKVEIIPPLTSIPNKSDRQAIVVLGGGMHLFMPEYQKPVPFATVLERLRYAMRIQRQTQLPILLSGGRVFPTSRSEAWVMNQVLIDDFQYEAKWLEEESRNTAQNGQNSFSILNKEGIQRIYLVTHASHMNRSKKIFENEGFDVTPAPTIFFSIGPNTLFLMKWLPNVDALMLSRSMLHEMLGQWWYAVRYHP